MSPGTPFRGMWQCDSVGRTQVRESQGVARPRVICQVGGKLANESGYPPPTTPPLKIQDGQKNRTRQPGRDQYKQKETTTASQGVTL